MILFPWLFLILILLILAELVVVVPVAIRSLVLERRVRLARPSMMLLAVLTLMELVIVLIWGLVLRPR